jgi:hypothetical protein
LLLKWREGRSMRCRLSPFRWQRSQDCRWQATDPISPQEFKGEFMKAIVVLILVLAASAAHAISPDQIVFKITSSAATATANLRIMKMTGGVKVQGMAFGPISNYFLTKSTTVQLEGTDALWIQVDQATKVYTNDATNYLTLSSGENYVITNQK